MSKKIVPLETPLQKPTNPIHDRKKLARRRKIERLKRERQGKPKFIKGPTEDTVLVNGKALPRLSIIKVNVEDDDDYPPVDPRLPQHPFRMGTVGPSGSGKTSSVINLIGRKDMFRGYFHRIHIFSPSLYTDPNWEVVLTEIPEAQLHDELSMEAIEKVVSDKEQELDNIHNKLKAKRDLLIVDDPVGKNIFSHSAYEGPMEGLQTTARQKGISTLFLVQNYNVFGKKVRNNFSDLLLIGDLLTNEELEDIAKEQKGRLSKTEFFSKFNEYVNGPHDPFYIRKKFSKAEDRFRPGFV